MRRQKRVRLAAASLFGLLLLGMTLLQPEARADEPMLVIQLDNGESPAYTMSEIERIRFEGEEFLVVETEGGSDTYLTEMIQRIEFTLNPASVEDPRDVAAVLDAIHLFQNQPNPFSSETRIGFELPRGGDVELSIYSPAGRLVRTLVLGERPAGSQVVRWDGLDKAARPASSGVYFYILRAPGIEESRRMILLP